MRRVAAVFVGTWVGLWIGRSVCWVLGLHGGLEIAALAVGGLFGCLVGIENARSLKRWGRQDRREAIVGWGVVGGLIAIIGVIGIVSTF